jgi:hypothetical protein
MRYVPIAAVLLALAACGGDSPSGPSNSYPNVAGSYQGGTAMAFKNSVENLAEAVGITVTLGSTTSSGAFTGSYVVANGGGSGTIAGVIRTDGGITITQWGDPTASPAQSYAVLANLFNWCNVALAGATGFSGSLSNGQLQLTGNLLMPCNYTQGGQAFSVPTTITWAISVTR